MGFSFYGLREVVSCILSLFVWLLMHFMEQIMLLTHNSAVWFNTNTEASEFGTDGVMLGVQGLGWLM